jgi:hypothetical protein
MSRDAYNRKEIELLLQMVAHDKSPSEIAGALHRSVYSIRVKARQLGVRWKRGSNFLILRNMDEADRAAFSAQAFAYGVTLEDYVGRLLQVIAHDNLFNAILDDDGDQPVSTAELHSA